MEKRGGRRSVVKRARGRRLTVGPRPYAPPRPRAPTPQQHPPATPPPMPDFPTQRSPEVRDHRFHGKTLSYVNDWPESIEEECVFLTSVGRGINIVYVKYAMIMIDCGAIRGSFSGFDLEERLRDHVFIKRGTEVMGTNMNVHYQRRHFEEDRRRRALFANNDTDSRAVRKSITAYLDKMFDGLPRYFKSIIITSSDEDNWKFLPNLFYDEKGVFRNNFRVESFIIHGHPSTYSDNFHALLEHLRDDMKDDLTAFYFTSLQNPLLSQSVPLHEYCSDVHPVGPKWYYDVLSNNYVNSLNSVTEELGFERHLQISTNVKVFIPVINGHHRLWRFHHWRVPIKFLPNEDCMAVAVQVNGFKFLFLSDDTLESQEEIAFALHQKWLPGHTRLLAVDVVILSHNSSDDDYSFEFISSFSPKMVICPIFFKEGHPSQTLYQSLKRIKSLQSSMPHKFYYYVKTTIEENGEDKEAFSKCEDSTPKLIFSLEHPISMMFNTTGGGYIRQFVPDPIPNS